MIYRIIFISLVINSVSPNVTQEATQSGTIASPTLLTTSPAQPPTTEAAQNGSITSSGPLTEPPTTVAQGTPIEAVQTGEVSNPTSTAPTTQSLDQDAQSLRIEVVQKRVTKIIYGAKKTTQPPAQVTQSTQKEEVRNHISTDPSTTQSSEQDEQSTQIEVVQEEVTRIISGAQKTTQPPAQGAVHCPKKYELIHSHCYHFSRKRVSWDVAMEECEVLGGRLAVIQDPESFKHSISQKDVNGSIYWVGAINSNGSWEWINGQKLDDQFPWGFMRPLNGSQEQSCLMLSQKMEENVVNQKTRSVNMEDDHTVKIKGGRFTNDKCDKLRRFICDRNATESIGCSSMDETNPELSGLSSIESLILSNTRRAPKYPAKCPKNFQNVAGICVYFSEVKTCWENAANFCKNLRIGTAREVTLAVLTEDVTQNHKLLEEVAKRGSSVWLGGFRDQLSMNHKWVDGRPVNLGDCHWNETEPDHSGNCISAEVKKMRETRRTYLHDQDCESPKYFICRATCPDGFVEYGDSCYTFNTEPVSWRTAETRCQDLSFGLDQNVHLATFGTDTEDDMNLLAEIAFQEKGFFHCFHGEMIGHQCMHIQSDKMDWESARITCEKSGMILAEPRDPQALASFMQNKSMTGEYHLGGHYVEGSMVWLNQDEPVFPNDISVWIKGFPGKNLSVESTLSMALDINGPMYIQVKGIHAKFICEEKNNYWVGGSKSHFKDWVWTDGRQVDLNSPYFAKKEPKLEKKCDCLKAEQSDSKPNKAFLKSDSCGALNRYICQASDINPFGKEFVKIGDGYYYISTMNNHSVTTWKEAQEICQGLEVPSMYRVDLAVLNRQDQRDSAFEIDFLSMNKGFSLWIGAHAVTTNNITNWVWVDTQPQHQEFLQPESIYWSLDLDTTPIEGANVYLTWDEWETSFNDVKQAIHTDKASIIARTYQGFRKPVLYWEYSNSTTLRAFVCQVFDKV